MPTIEQRKVERYGTPSGRRRTAWGLNIWLFAVLCMGLFALGYGAYKQHLTMRADIELFLGCSVVINTMISVFRRVRYMNELEQRGMNRETIIALWSGTVHMTFAVALLAALMFDAWAQVFRQ